MDRRGREWDKMPRYDDGIRDRSPDRRDRRMKSPVENSRRVRVREMSPGMGRGPPMRDIYDDYPPPPPKRESIPYKILCVANLNHKASDRAVQDALTDEFTRFGDVKVKVCHDANERFAYIYFRSYEDAREARHAKSRLILFDKQVEIDPIYERLPSRRRSLTPDGYGPPPPRRDHIRGPSPPPRREHRPPPPPPSHSMRSSNMDKHSSSMYSSRGSHPDMHREPPMRGEYAREGQGSGGSSSGGGGGGGNNSSNRTQQTRESKKEKFPNYLHHISPEDDDKATRTLFVGNLEVTISDADLRRIFERYGVVEDIDVKRPPPGQGNAYAFIKFLNLDMGHRAKVEMSGQYVGKFQCKIGYGKATPTTRIWLGGLGPWTSLSHLEREFDRFGAIRKIDFVKGDNHAYIQYDSIDAAQAACQEMRGFPLGGPDKRLRVDFADPGPYSSTSLTGSPPHGAPATTPPPDDSFYNASTSFANSPTREIPAAAPAPSEPYFNNNNSSPSTSTAWNGALILKNNAFPTRMLLCSGEPSLVDNLMKPPGAEVPMLRITQRLRLDPSKLEDVTKRMNSAGPQGYSVLLTTAGANSAAIGAGTGEDGNAVQQRPLRTLVNYLKTKDAAGVISLNGGVKDGKESVGVLYAFPPCVFAQELLERLAPRHVGDATKDDYLVVVVVR